MTRATEQGGISKVFYLNGGWPDDHKNRKVRAQKAGGRKGDKAIRAWHLGTSFRWQAKARSR